MNRFLILYERRKSAGITAIDSEEVRLKKVVLLFASGLMIVAAGIWLALYQSLGLYDSIRALGPHRRIEN